MDDSFLPPIHRKCGERYLHDDWLWPFCYIPRVWFSFRCVKPPKLIFGNQRYWSNLKGNVTLHDCPLPGENWGPKPVPRRGEWQISIVYTGKSMIPLPYFAITDEKGHGIRGGARWSDDENHPYVSLPGFAYKKVGE